MLLKISFIFTIVWKLKLLILQHFEMTKASKQLFSLIVFLMGEWEKTGSVSQGGLILFELNTSLHFKMTKTLKQNFIYINY